MKVNIILLLICFAFSAATVKGQTLENETDSLSYAIGVLFGQNIQTSIQTTGFQPLNAEIVARAIESILQGAGAKEMSLEEANMYVNMQYIKIQASRYEKNLVAGREFLERNRTAPGVVTLPSGLQYKIVTAGTGAKPAATDRVTVHYHGTLLDGTVFDSSVDRGEPMVFGVGQVIQGWIEALQLMPVGSKWILYIPHELAYGSTQRSGIEPYSTLTFEVELISINN